MSDPAITFPTLEDVFVERWHWPEPPYAWPHLAAPGIDQAQPCRIEALSGRAIEVELLGFEPAANKMRVRTRPEAEPIDLPFERFRRMTLSRPLHAAPPVPGRAEPERVPAAAQECEYRIEPPDGAVVLEGRTAGRISAAEGLYLFATDDEERALLRVFVPRWACHKVDFGSTAQDVAAEHWISTPPELLAAIERQHRAPVLRLGESLLELGLLTPPQLERVLAQPAHDRPLGQRLVAQGLITRADLQTALAHKMGYPLVDLTRFPIDPIATQRLPVRNLIETRAVPLMIDGERLIVAVDKPARTLKLQSLRALAGLRVVPVLASRHLIALALGQVSQQDAWASNVAMHGAFFASTTT